MSFVKWFLIVPAVTVVAVVVVGLTMPENRLVERNIIIQAPAERVFAAVVDFEQWRLWEPWGADDESLKVTYGEKRSGPGASYSWTGKKAGNGTIRMVEADPPRAVRLEYFFENDPEPSPSTFLIEPASGDAVKVTWSLEIRLGGNPFSRIFGPMVDGLVGRYHESGLEALKRSIEGRNEARE